MLPDPYIGETMGRRIDEALDAIAHEQRVSIIVAVESGSRAWRFPSTDSDYDVRFIYARPVEAYLSISPPRDVIETPIADALDLNGWDVRKALQLAVRSNAVLLEWLSSPVRYRDSPAAGELAAFARESCDLPGLAYHYDRLARHALDDIVASTDAVRFKAYCYALRPALALLAIRERKGPPPMDLPALLEGATVPDAVRQAIADLIGRKATGTEHDTAARQPVLDSFLAEVLGQPMIRPGLADNPIAQTKADALLSRLILGARVEGPASIDPRL